MNILRRINSNTIYKYFVAWYFDMFNGVLHWFNSCRKFGLHKLESTLPPVQAQGCLSCMKLPICLLFVH